jgi:GTPase SAR1 family protein
MSEMALKRINKCFSAKNLYLDLGRCGLKDIDFITGSPIDKALRSCIHIKRLTLSNAVEGRKPTMLAINENNSISNQLTAIPPAITELINLSEFLCAGDANKPWGITCLSPLSSLTSLQLIDLTSNAIDDLKGLENLVHLKQLRLSFNKIKIIEGLEKLIELQELYLSANEIQEIEGLKSLVKLQELYLGNNQIKIIEGLESLTNLKILFLNDNGISKIKPINTLVQLEELDISGNAIKDIFPLLAILQKRIAIKLTTDKLSESDFKGIDISRNPLVRPPIEIVRRGYPAIANYFKELEKQGRDFLYEAKMLIIGQPRAGKTSLRYKLFDTHAPLPGEDETTRGIDIKRLSFDIKDKDGEKRKFYYNIWDFGGQHIYQTTHQFFLTHRSLYALVMDTGKDSTGNDETTVNYWLQVVELLGGNSPLLLILNEKNERKISIDVPQKKARFDFLTREYNIDLNALVPDTKTFNIKKQEEFEHLKKDIETELIRLPLVGFPMPSNWIQIREELQNLSVNYPYINIDRYRSICIRYDVNEYERQLELSSIFHDLGVFLHFQDYGILDDFIVLQNTWATDAVFAVLDNQTVKQNNGHFTDNDLAGIWEPKGYNKFVHKKLLGLMMQFELCYQIDKSPKQSSYIVPEMLPDTPPEGYSWQPVNDLPLQYRYDFMPKGLLTRLIVRLHRHIYTEDNQQWVWKTGVKIDSSQMDYLKTYAEITESWDNKQLNIRTQGRFSKELMNIISYEIDELNKNYFKQIDKQPKSRWYKMIPCSCITCKDIDDKHFYDYRELLERKDYGKETIECKKKPFATLNINQLMDGVFSKEKKQPIRTQQDNPKKVFISYSKDDLLLINKFIEHLSALQLDGKISHWYCTELTAGIDWHYEIQEHFDQSDIVCFMVSPNFMRTKYIHEHEIKKAFERQTKDPKFKIVPIILDFCKWTTNNNNLGLFTALPYTAKPVMDFKNQNMAWYIIQECLRLMIEKDLHPTGEDFYTSQALPKDVLKLLERIVQGKADA